MLLQMEMAFVHVYALYFCLVNQSYLYLSLAPF